MNNIKSDFVEKLVKIMQNNELTEVVLEDSKASLVIKSNGYKPVVKEKEQPVIETVIENPVLEVEEKKNLVPIKSTMIGVFYAKPSPNDKPFVNVGDEIKEGQTICIIETIKLMNKITTDISGKIAEICVEDGKPVEYGQVIMYVEQ